MAEPLTGAALQAANEYVDIKRKLKGPRDGDNISTKLELTWEFPHDSVRRPA
jgi:hypothetical protein